MAMSNGVPAAITEFDISASSTWRATTDQAQGNQWLQGIFNRSEGDAAWLPYQARTTNTMWACGPGASLCKNANGLITGVDGPTQAFFALDFSIEPTTRAAFARMQIIADDYFELYVNGQFVRDGLLDLIGGPVSVDFLQFLHDGENVLAIRAMDGHLKQAGLDCNSGAYLGGPFTEVSTHLGQFCKGNRANESLNINGRVVVPEPGPLSIVALGVAGVVLSRRRSTGATKSIEAA